MDEILKYFPNLTDIQRSNSKSWTFIPRLERKNKCYFEKDIDACTQSIFSWELFKIMILYRYLCS
jgi:hypothetical protein